MHLLNLNVKNLLHSVFVDYIYNFFMYLKRHKFNVLNGIIWNFLNFVFCIVLLSKFQKYKTLECNYRIQTKYHL